jgi:hypothetical protein
LSHVYLIAYEFVGLANQRLGKFETQHRGIEPVKTAVPALGLLDENVE